MLRQYSDLNCLSPLGREELRQMCSRIKHIALDMDGTLYLGNNLFNYTLDFLSEMRHAGIGYSFLTNNPTKSVADYLAKLDGMGIYATADQMYTSAVATIDYIRYNHPDARRIFALGTPSMLYEMRQAGFEIVEDSADDVPELLVVAFDTTLTYNRLCRAAWWVAQGIPYIATNPDRVCPTNLPVILVDCGSICQAIAHAVGREPDVVIGKPNPDMLTCIMHKHGLQPDEIAMCGDRIYTDVASAVAANAVGVLVLSGETTMEIVEKSSVTPHIIVPTVQDLGRLILECTKSV